MATNNSNHKQYGAAGWAEQGAQLPVGQAAIRISRRRLLGLGAGALAAPAASLWPWQETAAQQLEEPLVDSVRSALQAAIANATPPEPVFADTASRLAYLRWLTATSDKLARRMPSVAVRHEFLQTVWYESKRAGLDTAMILGLIQVESGFRKHVVSHAGALGYMQIMPFWTRVIGDGDPAKLFHMQTNLRFGNVIMRHYLDIEKGNLFMALGRYNGSRGRATYPNAVFAAQRQWEFEDRSSQSATAGAAAAG
ncbi:lytic transglycosylase domain-containing protein [Vandammella animalimorsus]|uniref:Lytic transglycosylase domain-containing protein n=1 Tax=Vandammella animalimorsus TaxID=2029117 RepID=A0A3M6RLN4_9BURK|nr:lytic transglycosylase domain-containing protein [Vandammella animalimorsus]